MLAKSLSIKRAEVPRNGAESVAKTLGHFVGGELDGHKLSLKGAEVPPSGTESVAKTTEHFVGGALAGQEFVAKKSRSVAMRC